MDAYVKNGIGFLDAALSPFHAVKAAAERLSAAGYTALAESGAWPLAPGGRYYTTRNGSSIVAWRMPGGASAGAPDGKPCGAPDGADAPSLRGWRGTLSHSDSPTFRISKTDASGKDGYGRVRIEEYGGPRWSTWMDRPLRVAGRLFVRTEGGIEPVLVSTDALLVIPTLCCHFDREGRFGEKLDMSRDMQPIFCAGPAAGETAETKDLMNAVRKAAKLPKNAEIVGYDLVLALAEKATVLGTDGGLICSPRLDDLAAAATTLDGFLRAGEAAGSAAEKAPNGLESSASSADVCDVWAMFDNEEVGSQTRQGAASSFLPDVMARIEEALGLSRGDAIRARANSLFLSVDNGHATHPNRPEKSDPAHPIALNGGVVVKVTANQKYTTTAMTAALFGEICRRANVPTQVFYNNPSVIGGGTLGNILSRAVSVPMIDIGLPQLSMHSAMETAGTRDFGYMVCAAEAFYRARLAQTTDGAWTICG